MMTSLGHVQVGDALVGVDHRQRRAALRRPPRCRPRSPCAVFGQRVDLGHEVAEAVVDVDAELVERRAVLGEDVLEVRRARAWPKMIGSETFIIVAFMCSENNTPEASDVDASDSLSVSGLTVMSGDDTGVTVSGNSLSVDPGAYNSLAVGESQIITYSYSVIDGNGGTVAQMAAITITGTNDAPTVSSAVAATATEDDASFSVNLLATASDVDASDSLSVSGLMVIGGDASGVTVSSNTLSVDPNAYNSLAVGESEVITYSYDVIDSNGGIVAQMAAITITGTNDAPTVSSAVTASATEDDASFSVDLLAGAADVDASDTLSVSGLTVTGGNDSGVTVSGNSLSVDPGAYNSLAVGDSEDYYLQL